MTSFTGSIINGQSLANDDFLLSPDGRYAAVLQDDGNFVLCHAAGNNPQLNRPYWSAAADAVGNFVGSCARLQSVALMQNDGNFVLYNGTNPAHHQGPYWATNTVPNSGGPTFLLDINNEGLVCLTRYLPQGETQLWEPGWPRG